MLDRRDFAAIRGTCRIENQRYLPRNEIRKWLDLKMMGISDAAEFDFRCGVGQEADNPKPHAGLQRPIRRRHQCAIDLIAGIIEVLVRNVASELLPKGAELGFRAELEA